MNTKEPLTYRVRRIPVNVSGINLAQFLCDVVSGLELQQLRIASLAPTPDDRNRYPSQTATLQISGSIPRSIALGINEECSVRVPGQLHPLLFDTHFLGFTPLNKVDSQDYSFDLIAISGLASHPFGSWRKHSDEQNVTSSPSFMWLRDQLPHDFPSIRVMIYGYDTKLLKSESFKTIDDIAISFIDHLRDIGKALPSTKPILILAHSLGGIIVKRALCDLADSRESEHFMLSQIKMVMFFGVPSLGMKMSSLLPMVNGQPNRSLIECLSDDCTNGYLQSLNESFSGISQLQEIRLVSAFETERTRTVIETAPGIWTRSGDPVVLVSRESATQACTNRSDIFSIDRDHSNMVKFVRDDTHYLSIKRIVTDVTKLDDHPADATTTMDTTVARPNRMSAQHDGSRANSTGVWSSSQISDGDGLKSLFFPEIQDREDHITLAHQESYRWLMEPAIGLLSWLASRERLYWIQGKPGSGKSTLMKYLRTDLRKMEHKQKSETSQHFVFFFFHARGSYLQKSVEGLIRSILYQLGSGNPPVTLLIQEYYMSKDSRRRDLWTEEDLLELFERVTTKAKLDKQIVLFLDALDEFNGFPETMAELLLNVTTISSRSEGLDIKICFASRPWDVFVDRFRTCKGFKLQDWTQQDMRAYSRGRLHEILKSPKLRLDDGQSCSNASDLLDQIVAFIGKHANGVFLWAHLVLDDIETFSDTSSEAIMSKLNSLPKDLESYYDHSIKRIAPKDRREAFIILELALRADFTLLVKEIFLASQCANGSTFIFCKRHLETSLAEGLDDNEMSIRLKDLCGGLLQVVRIPSGLSLEFIHQTAKDFAGSPGSRQRLLAGDYQALSGENGHLFWMKYGFAHNSLLYSFKIGDERLLDFAHAAERTTGRHFGGFLDSVPNTFFHDQHAPQGPRSARLLFNSRLSFAVAANLELYVSRLLESEAAKGPSAAAILLDSNPRTPLVRFLCRRVNQLNSLSFYHVKNQISSYRAMLELLIKYGLDFNSQGACDDALRELGRVLERRYVASRTPTTPAVEVFDCILQQGGNPDVHLKVDSNRFCRPLHVCTGQMAIVLLKHGANPNALDSHGLTPLDTRLRFERNQSPTYFVDLELETILKLVEAGGQLSRWGQRCFHNRIPEAQKRKDIGYISERFLDHGGILADFARSLNDAKELPPAPTREELEALYPELLEEKIDWQQLGREYGIIVEPQSKEKTSMKQMQELFKKKRKRKRR